MWALALKVDWRRSSVKSSALVFDRWVSNCVGFSRWLFFFFLFRLLVVMRLWVCDLVMILVVGGHGCDNGSCCSYGGTSVLFYFIFVFNGGGQ